MFANMNKMHKSAHGVLKNAEGGTIRGTRGKLVEEIIKETWEFLGGTVEKQKFQCTRGNQTCNMGLDATLYKNDIIKGHVECKSYLDLACLERAEWNCREMKENGLDQPKIILALENSVRESSKDYVLEGNYIDEIFYLCEGKRSSNKPIYKEEFFKELNEEYFSTFYTYLKNLID